MFRGFEKRDEGTGFLFVVLGHDDPGKVVWAPSVFKMAEDYRPQAARRAASSIDTTLGEKVPEGAEMEQPPDAAKLKELATPPMSRAQQICGQGRRHEGQSQLAARRPGRRGRRR